MNVYPVYLAPDKPAYLGGVPAVPLSIDDVLAERLVRTGAFALEPSELAPDSADPIELSPPELEAATTRIDFYDPPLPHGAHYKNPFRVNPERLEPEVRQVLLAVRDQLLPLRKRLAEFQPNPPPDPGSDAPAGPKARSTKTGPSDSSED
jgi:hypothetical protein